MSRRLVPEAAAEAPSSSAAPENGPQPVGWRDPSSQWIPVSQVTNTQAFPPAQAVQPMSATYSVPSPCDEPVPQVAPHICNVCGYPPPQYRNNTERNVPCKQCGYVANQNEPQFQRAVHPRGFQAVRNARAPAQQGPPLPTTNVPAQIFQPIAQSTTFQKPRLPVQPDGNGFEMPQVSSIGEPRGQSEPPESCMHCCFQPDAQRQQGGVFPPTRNAMQGVQQRPRNAAPAPPQSTQHGEPYRWQSETCLRCCSSGVADPAVVSDQAVVADQAAVPNVPPITPVSYRLLDSLEPVPLGGFLGGGGGGGGGGEREGVGVGGATEFFLLDEKSGKAERWNLSPAAKYSFKPAQSADEANLLSVAPAEANQAVKSVQQRYLNVPVPAQADKSRKKSGVAKNQIPRQYEEPGPQLLQRTAVSGLNEAEAASPFRLVPMYRKSERSQRQSFEPSEEPRPQLPQQSAVSGLSEAEAASPSRLVPMYRQSEQSQRQSFEPSGEPRPQLPQQSAVSGLSEAEAASPSRLVPKYPQSERSQRQSFEPSEEPRPQLPQQTAVSGPSETEARSTPRFVPRYSQIKPRRLIPAQPSVQILPEPTAVSGLAEAEGKKPNWFVPQLTSSQVSQVPPYDRSGRSTFDTGSSIVRESRLRESFEADPSRKTHITAENRFLSADSLEPDASAAMQNQLSQRESVEIDTLEKAQIESEESSGIPSSQVAQLAAALQNQVPEISREFQSESPRTQEELRERLAALCERREKLMKAYLLSQQLQSRLPEATDAATPGQRSSESPPVSVIVIQSPPGAKGKTSHAKTSQETSPAQPQRQPQGGRSGSVSSETSRQSGSPTAAQIRRSEGPAASDGDTSQRPSQGESPAQGPQQSQRSRAESASPRTSRPRWSPGRIFKSSASSKGSASRRSSTPRESAAAAQPPQPPEADESLSVSTQTGRQRASSAAPAADGHRRTEDYDSPDISSYDLRGNYSEEFPRLMADTMGSDEDLDKPGTTTGDTSYSGAGRLLHDTTYAEDFDSVHPTFNTTKEMSVKLIDLLRDLINEEHFDIPIRRDLLESTRGDLLEHLESIRGTSVGSRSLTRDVMNNDADIDRTGKSYADTLLSSENTSFGLRRIYDDVITEEDINATGGSKRGTPDSARNVSAGLRSVTRDAITEEDFNATGGSKRGTPDSARNVSAGLRRVTRDTITEEDFSATSPKGRGTPDSARNTYAELRRVTRDLITEEDINATGGSKRGTPDSARNVSAGLRTVTHDAITEEDFSATSPKGRGTPDSARNTYAGLRRVTHDLITEEDINATGGSKRGTPDSARNVSAGLRKVTRDAISPSPESAKRRMSRPTSTPRESAAAQSRRLSQADESLPLSASSSRKRGSATPASESLQRTEEGFKTAGTSDRLSLDTAWDTCLGSKFYNTITEECFKTPGTSDRRSLDPTWETCLGSRSPARDAISPSPESTKRSMSRPRDSAAAQTQRLSQADESRPLSPPTGRQSVGPTPASARHHRSPSPESTKQSMPRPTSAPRESPAAQTQRLSQADESRPLSTPTGRQSGSPTSAAARHHRRSSEDETISGETGDDTFTSDFFSPVKTERSTSPKSTKGSMSRPTSAPRESPVAQSRRLSQPDESRPLSTPTGRQSGSPTAAARHHRRSSEDETTSGETGGDIFKSAFFSPLKMQRSPGPAFANGTMSRPTSPPRESPVAQSRRLSQPDESRPFSTPTGRQSGSPKSAAARHHRSPGPEFAKGSMSQPTSPPRESAAAQSPRLSQADESLYVSAQTGRHSGSPTAAADRLHRNADENTTGRSSSGAARGNTSSGESDQTPDSKSEDEADVPVRQYRRASDPVGITSPALRRELCRIMRPGEFGATTDPSEPVDIALECLRKNIIDLAEEAAEAPPDVCAPVNVSRGLTIGRIVRNSLEIRQEDLNASGSRARDVPASTPAFRKYVLEEWPEVYESPTGSSSDSASNSRGNSSPGDD